MTIYPIHGDTTPPLPFKNTTALLLIDCQYGYRHPTAWGKGLSTPNFEDNIKKLLREFRSRAEGKSTEDSAVIFNGTFRTVWSDSPLHVTHKGPYGLNGEEKRGIDVAEYAIPRCRGPDGPRWVYSFDEPDPATPENPNPQPVYVAELDKESISPSIESIITKHGHSLFTPPFLSHLNDKGIKTLIMAGMTTDGCVAAAVHAAYNLGVTGKWGGTGNQFDSDLEKLWTEDGASWCLKSDEALTEPELNGYAVNVPRLVVISDATRAFGKGGFEAEVVHGVHLESLKEYAEVLTTDEVLGALGR